MSKITIFLRYYFKNDLKHRSVERDLWWYDHSEPSIDKRLKKYRGGTLVHKYDYRGKRQYVEVADLKEKYYERTSNEQEVRHWLNSVGSRLGAEINLSETSTTGLAIDVGNLEVEIVEHSLDSHGIRHERL